MRKLHRFCSEHIGTDYSDVSSANRASFAEYSVKLGTAAPEGFRRVRVHDLKHTFGLRLRAAGVSFENRQDLLGLKSSRITTHYSEAELANLIAAAEKACNLKPRKTPAISWATGATRAQAEDNSLIWKGKLVAGVGFEPTTFGL